MVAGTPTRTRLDLEILNKRAGGALVSLVSVKD
jgi:hypothetical protein